MSIPGSLTPLFSTGSSAAAAGYQVERSLRFNSADSAYLSRTPAVAGDKRIWSFSVWAKRAAPSAGTQTPLISTSYQTGGNRGVDFGFGSSDALNFGGYNESGGNNFTVVTSSVYRDFSAWMHLLIAVDTTQATPANRVRIYVNGQEVTTFSSNTYPTQNDYLELNSTEEHFISCLNLNGTPQRFVNAYLAECYLIDGQQLTPSSFTEVSATTGQLIPLAYSGTFGTNGFWLKFSDNSAATAATLGNDYSGNNNDWTPNNLSVTAGAGNDSLVDTPTSFGTDTYVGGEVRGNYCTLNPLSTTNGTYTQGNLRYEGANSSKRSNGTLAVSTGKWYWEVTLGNAPYAPRAGDPNDTYYNAFGFGISSSFNSTLSYRTSTDSLALGDNGFYKNFTGSETDVGTAFSSGDVLSIAVDLDINTFTFRRNNTQIATGTIGGTAGRELVPIIISYSGQYGVMDCNFGQRPFAYTAPSGFKALCDTNLGAPLVAKPNTLMDVALWTGNTTARTISGLNFSPDLVWIKNRSTAQSHTLYDTVRGATLALVPNGTDGELTLTNFLTAFTSDGFSIGTDNNPNGSGNGIVAWAWDAGTSTVSNTAGSITSQVRANASAGFSVVTYTGNAVQGATVGHGLGVAPSFIITKARSNLTAWGVYHASVGATKGLELNDPMAAYTTNGYWNNTAPTSTVWSNYYFNTNNASGYTYVAYCWAPVVGYSAFGSFAGNGSSDGPFIYTGMRPKWLLVKKAVGGTSDWWIWDVARDTYNVADSILYPNIADEEVTDAPVFGYDILSNGFKVRNANGTVNNAAHTYIYAAFAENPFQYSRAR